MARTAPVLLVILWSSGFVGATLAARSAPAETTLLWRYAVAAPVMVVLVTALGRRYSARYARREAVLGTLGQVGYLYGVFRAADAGLPAGTTALVASLQPALVAVVLAAVPSAAERRGSGRSAPEALGRSARRRRWLALAAGFAGVVLTVSGGGTGVGSGPAGIIWAASGMLSLATATLLAERWPQPERRDVLDSLAVQSVVALAAFGVVAVASGRALPPPDPAFWPAVAWLVVLSFAGGYGAYLWVLRTSGAVTVSAWLYLTPAVSAAWGWLMFDDALSWQAVAGFAVALVAVLGMRGTPDRPIPPGRKRNAESPEVRRDRSAVLRPGHRHGTRDPARTARS